MIIPYSVINSADPSGLPVTENGFEPKSVIEVVTAFRYGRFIFDIFPTLLNYFEPKSHFLLNNMPIF